MVTLGADTRPTFVSPGVPLASAPPLVDSKIAPVNGIVSVAGPLPQGPAVGSTGQTLDATVPAAVPAAPTVVVKQPEPGRPYTGAASYKAYKEYFERICLCNDWKSPTECARHLLVAINGPASEVEVCGNRFFGPIPSHLNDFIPIPI